MPAAPLAPLAPIAPYLAVHDALRAVEWYVEALGAERFGDPVVMDDGRIGHVELRIGGSLVMMADEHPEIDFRGPQSRGGTTVSLMVHVEDSEATVSRAVGAGAELERPVTENYGQRMGVIRDPFGHRWMVATPVEPVEQPTPAQPPRAHGDVGYFTLGVPEAAKAQAFYGAVLGWGFEPGSHPDGFQITNVSPPGGIAGGAERWSITHAYRVTDVDAAAALVQQLGGEADEPSDRPYGRLAECVDDQGTPFQLWQPPPA
jgi:uncharacterized glyoxalase superfamily protein PhnB/catechol 2,3-dioxygenase-like lactoylglutathione lyase family enzyme